MFSISGEWGIIITTTTPPLLYGSATALVVSGVRFKSRHAAYAEYSSGMYLYAYEIMDFQFGNPKWLRHNEIADM